MEISQAAIDLAESLHRHAIAWGSSTCALLVDPVLRDPVDDPSWEPWRADIDARSMPVRLPGLDVDPSAWPRLIALDLARPRDADINRAAAGMALADWQADALRGGRGHRIGAWLFGAIPGPQLARHLGSLLLQAHPDGGRALLRAQDPGVFDVLWGQLRAAQRIALLGPVDRWVYVDRWRHLAIATGERHPGEGAVPCRLAPEQWARLETVGALNRAWRRLPPEHRIDARQLEGVLAALGRAVAHGLADERDWEAYAWRALSVHPEFDRHPLISDLLDRRAADTGFGRLVSDVSDAQWDVIRSDCRGDSMPRAIARNVL